MKPLYPDEVAWAKYQGRKARGPAKVVRPLGTSPLILAVLISLGALAFGTGFVWAVCVVAGCCQ